MFGFMNTLLTLLQTRDPEHLGVIFDAPGPTFRHEQFEDYKATRPPTPVPIIEQLPIVCELLDAMSIARLERVGYEADDIIATLATRFADQTPVDIISGDKDLLQLVTDKVSVIRPGRGSVLENVITPENIVEILGLPAEQVVDYLALVGDTSDNVPGVRGVGQKTALKLLLEYGGLDGIYNHLDDLGKGATRKKLEASRTDAYLSRQLVTLHREVPLEVTLNDFARGSYDRDRMKALLTELEFDRLARSLLDAEPKAAPEPLPTVSTQRYHAVTDESALANLAAVLRECDEFAVDTETSSPDPMSCELAGISVSTEPGNGWYVPVTSTIPGDGPTLFDAPQAPGLSLNLVRQYLADVFAASTPKKIGQNIKFDAIVLERSGLPLSGIGFDTMIASYCLDPARRSHSLDNLAKDFFAHEMIHFADLFERRTSKKDIRTVPLEKVVDYASEDADYTLRLQQAFAPMIEASPARSLFYEVEMPLSEVLRAMEMTGVAVDVAFLGEMSTRYAEQIGKLEEAIFAEVGERFNINSTPTLRDVLFNKLGLKPSRKTKTGYSTDVDVLNQLADQHAVPKLLLQYRQLVKLKSTYIDALPRLVNAQSQRVHTSYNQAVASTGRLSSSDPNLQNIPIRTDEGREIRRAFVADNDWVLVDADYSQIELRILAHASRDEGLIEAFREDADIHRRTAAKILGKSEADVSDEMRNRAKTVNFGIVYGMGARGLAQSLDIDVAEAKTFIDEYFASYPGVKRFIDETINGARESQHVSTLLGRLRNLPDINSANGRARSFSERIAVNTPIQGTAADIIKLAMLNVDQTFRERGYKARMILQVHDELLFEVPPDEVNEVSATVRECMEQAIALEVPLKVDIGTGKNWLEAH